MKHLLFLLLFPAVCWGQKKPDTLAKYHLTESQIIQISNLLSYGDVIAGNSDKMSTREYKAYHAAVVSVDSILRVQWDKIHPKKAEPKKP